MKRVVLLFVAVFCFSHFYAQDPIVVDKLLYKQSDLTASTQPRLDQNGDVIPCNYSEDMCELEKRFYLANEKRSNRQNKSTMLNGEIIVKSMEFSRK